MNKTVFNVIWLTIFAGLFRIPFLGEQSLWFDELYTVFIARIPIADSLTFLVTDAVHPPLYYWLERLIVYFSDSETSARIIAAIFGVIAIPSLYIFGRRWVGERGGIIAALLLAVSPFHIWYSQEARMYSTLALLTVVCFGLYELFLNQDRKIYRFIFVAVSSVAYLIHYFALLIPLVQFIHLVISLKRYPRKIINWTLIQLLAAIPILGWVFIIANRKQNTFGIGWIPIPKPIDLIYTMMNFSVGFDSPVLVWRWIGLLLSITLILFGMRFQWRISTMKTLTVIWAFFPIVFIYLLSIKRPAYVDRFLIISLPAFLLLVSCGIVIVSRRWSAYLTTLVVGFFLWGWYSLNFGANKIQKENWRDAVRYVSENIDSTEVLILRELQIAIPFQQYANDIEFTAMQINQNEFALNEIARGNESIWLVYWNASADAHKLGSSLQRVAWLEQDPLARSWFPSPDDISLERVDFAGVTIFQIGR